MQEINESFSSLATYDTADSRTTDHFLHAWTTRRTSSEIKRNKKEQPEPWLCSHLLVLKRTVKLTGGQSNQAIVQKRRLHHARSQHSASPQEPH
jgi:hypothetical protein